MTLDRAVNVWAGLLVLAGVAISLYVDPRGIWLSAFVGFMLVQSSFTGFCPSAMIFKALGVKPGEAYK